MIGLSTRGSSRLTVLLTFALSMTSVYTRMSDDVRGACDVSDDQRTAVCRRRNLTEPPQYLPRSVEVLDLSRNRIKTVIAKFWIRYPELRHLNLSTCGLSVVRDTSFSGLTALLSLDLTNNPALARLPRTVFSSLTSLRRLFIGGEPVPPAVLTSLRDVEQLTMTFRDKPPSELARLSKLKVLTFAFSSLAPSGGRITADMLEHLANSSVEELAFHSCDVSKISRGSFDHFTRLRLLSFACNSRLQISNAIDVLSAMRTPQPVDSLILDGTQNTLTIFGQDEADSCRPAWSRLRRLSLRNTNLYGFNVNFVGRCLRNLRSVSLGFNHPLFFNIDSAASFFAGGHALRWLFQHASGSLTSVDASYLLRDDRQLARALAGCDKNQAWIPSNEEFFPPTVPSQPAADRLADGDRPAAAGSADGHRSASWSALMRDENCLITRFPDNLTYLGLQNVGGSESFFSTSGRLCVIVLANSLRHLNLSASNVIGSRRHLGSIYGLHRLHTLDLSWNGLVEFSFAELDNFPSLGVLILKGNRLNEGRLSAIGRHKRLRVLDLSYNHLARIPEDMFGELTSLSVLNLRGNRLLRIDFVTKNLATLSLLDVGQNELRTIVEHDADIMDSVFGARKDFAIKLDRNPFRCSCNSKTFIRWIQTTSINIKDRNKLTCRHEPRSRTYITSVDVSEYTCTSRERKIG